MNVVYNLTAHITYAILSVYGIFHRKIGLFVRGRKETFSKLSVLTKEDKVVWIHTASLGEFEQARPLIEKLRERYPKHKIVISFFSPSGYEIRKDYPNADIICYLPFDTKGRMKRFIQMMRPSLAIIVKYEFWPNLLYELKRKEVPTILVSGIFRSNQHFFKSSGGWMRKALNTFNHFFVQDISSKELLQSINISKVTVSGDTRFDRVLTILEQDNSLDFMERFKNDQYTFVAGSTWPEGEKYLVNYINDSSNQKFIIAPHSMNSKNIQQLKDSIQKKVILFSEKDHKKLRDFDVMIVDTIGLLTKIYSYADAVYVGGGFKTGLHNILEPATFGIPVLIGPEFQKFKEAVDLVNLGGAIPVRDQKDFIEQLDRFYSDKTYRIATGKMNSEYIRKQKGATKMIMDYIDQIL